MLSAMNSPRKSLNLEMVLGIPGTVSLKRALKNYIYLHNIIIIYIHNTIIIHKNIHNDSLISSDIKCVCNSNCIINVIVFFTVGLNQIQILQWLVCLQVSFNLYVLSLFLEIYLLKKTGSFVLFLMILLPCYSFTVSL